jgi:hypothetical protein
MPWYHEASRLTEIAKIRDKYGVPGFSGEPNRVEDKDNPIGFAYLLGAICTGLGLGTVFHSGQARDAQVLSGVQLEAAIAFIRGCRDLSSPATPTFINGHWGEAPVTDVKWYDPPRGSQAWRIFTFQTDNNNAKMLITGSPDPANWRNAFGGYQHGWHDVGVSTIFYGCPVIDLKR